MGWQDRDYASQDQYARTVRRVYRGPGLGRFDVVTLIIAANVAAYLFFPPRSPGQSWFVMQAAAVWHGQIWRLFTATYLHASFMHIFFNMLILYFFGPMLLRRWGPRQFFIVYTLGGVAGNVLLTLAASVGFIHPGSTGLGASGSVWALMAAGAMYYPNTEVLIYFLFPVRLRTVVIVYGLWYVWNVYEMGANYGGDLCHLAGLGVGLWWAYTGGWSTSGRYRSARSGASLLGGVKSLFRGARKPRSSTGAWQNRVKQSKNDAETVDRILAKVYEKGVHSLSPDEKRALTQASERQRAEEAHVERTDRP